MSTLLDAHFVIVNVDRDHVLTLMQESMCHLVSLLPLISNANPHIRDPSTKDHRRIFQNGLWFEVRW
jgi:hypothetical protein